MINLTLYGGVNEIGGNKILLEAEDTSVFLDFGISYGRKSLFYEEFLCPRGVRGLLDPLVMGLLPPLKGIYRSDFELPEEAGWQFVSKTKQVRNLELDGVFLSHAHLDHSGYISFLKPDIPIFCSPMTAFLAKAIQDSGKTGFESEVSYLVPKKCEDGCIKSTNYRQESSRQRPFKLLYGDELSSEAKIFWETTSTSRELNYMPLEFKNRIKNLNVKGFPVDHSLWGAAAIAIETSAGWVVYTGDLRLHGGRGYTTREFMEKVAQLKPLALICEGTNIDEDVMTSEEEIYKNSLEAVKRTKNLVIADFGPRNIERLLTFRKVAEETGRKLVLLAKDIYFLESMRLIDPSIKEFSTDPVCCLYDKIKGSINKWEREILKQFSDKLVAPKDIRQNQDDYIVCMSFWDINELPDLMPKEGSIYIYSTCEAFNEEMAISFDRLRNWLDYFNLTLVGDPEKGEKGFHASGHIIGPQLLELIRTINPKYLIPVHTEKPEFFQKNLKGEMEVILP
ncbi:MBL fold metallo-hydrolase RNA specificity domain-containing protein, partial [Candidatus Oleimmundimicrobium sp.]|uniref:MBL fold metallo-hydrolase RNA specificity domain-containing protein n=1 Tax=Candidatus Oleimmundimicrobium sp. TaxID=3060597 RepID=UPI00271F3676